MATAWGKRAKGMGEEKEVIIFDNLGKMWKEKSTKFES